MGVGPGPACNFPSSPPFFLRESPDCGGGGVLIQLRMRMKCEKREKSRMWNLQLLLILLLLLLLMLLLVLLLLLLLLLEIKILLCTVGNLFHKDVTAHGNAKILFRFILHSSTTLYTHMEICIAYLVYNLESMNMASDIFADEIQGYLSKFFNSRLP